jgi:hypothetical protein
MGLLRLVLPKPLEAIRRERGVARGILNVAVSQVGLQRAGIVARVRQGIATGVAEPYAREHALPVLVLDPLAVLLTLAAARGNWGVLG